MQKTIEKIEGVVIMAKYMIVKAKKGKRGVFKTKKEARESMKKLIFVNKELL